ncbi:MAG: twin-arginine translocase TatA/TatE family subunit [Chloroflexi bacterium]|jgi:sec-independent protein translocase protein TatA|nr:twin-arginine translocase TatA/TatE family subunit [Chloroflexota bacterium]
MGSLHWPEILLIAFILLLVFGVGRITKIGGEMGAGIRAFREGLSGKKEDETEDGKNDPVETEKDNQTDLEK